VEATFARDPARVASLRVGVPAKAAGPTDQIHCDEVLACELLVFVRDDDGDPDRDPAIRDTLGRIASYGFADEYGYELAVVGGLARPKLEGWILCLRGVLCTDEMTRAAVDRVLADSDVGLKSTEDYVAVVEVAVLPRGAGSLADWLRRAAETMAALIDGAQR
jgi:hypothetical protein